VSTWIELLGAILSVAAVWLTAIRNGWCWPIGLASVIVYAWVFATARLYSDALLQGFFGTMIVYGWINWSRHLGDDGRVRIAPLPRRLALLHVIIGALGALLLGAVMHHWTNAALPWLDAALTAFSVVGQWWQDRRHIAAWWMWIGVDVIYVGEYVYKQLLITSVLYALFVALAVIGLRKWQRAHALASA
jgi:nicotinamide mononucleotide transporter